MPRQARTELAGGLHHVTARTMPGRSLFANDEDRRRYLRVVATASASRDWQLLAYCLIGNHIHLLVRTPHTDLGNGIKEAHELQAMRLNRREGVCGHVFRDRFHNALVRTDSHARACLRYIARNPVKARMCASAAAWPWSSHRALAGLQAVPSMLDARAALAFFGDDERAARRAYIRSVAMSDIALVRELRRSDSDAWMIEAVDDHGIEIATVADVLGVHKSTAYRRLAAARSATEGTVP